VEVQLNDAKSILLSKTFWFNALSLASALIIALTPVLEKDNALDVLRVISYVTPVVNVLLRFATTQPVQLPGK
jgi:hypothetical protein